MTAPALGAPAATSGSPKLVVQDIPSAALIADATCPVAGLCYAVGFSGSPREGQDDTPLVTVLRGGKWTQVPLPVSVPASAVSISCTAVGECSALVTGNYPDTTKDFLEVLHGGKWTQRTLPGNATWHSIRCSAPQVCVIAGTAPQPSRTVFLTINGGKVTEITGPTLSGSFVGDQPVVHRPVCAAAAWCLAYGSHYTSNGSRAFAEVVHAGAVTLLTLPTPAGVKASTITETDLSTVLCPAVGECTAYGNYTVGQSSVRPMTVVLHHGKVTASALRIVQDPTPGVAKQSGEPIYVTCTGIGSCVGSASGDHDFIDTLKSDGWHARAVVTPKGQRPIAPQGAACKRGEQCYVSAVQSTSAPDQFPAARTFEYLPSGRKLALPTPKDEPSVAPGLAVCAANTDFCVQFAYYGDFAAGSVYTTYSVTITG